MLHSVNYTMQGSSVIYTSIGYLTHSNLQALEKGLNNTNYSSYIFEFFYIYNSVKLS